MMLAIFRNFGEITAGLCPQMFFPANVLVGNQSEAFRMECYQ